MGLQHNSRLWTKHIWNELTISRQYSYLSSLDSRVFLLSISDKSVITPKSSLFYKLCCPCHFLCRAFVQRMFIPMSVTLLPLSMSPAYPKTSVSLFFILHLINSFWFGARVGWCGMHQCPPSNGLAPSTSAHYLGLRLETYIVLGAYSS